MGNVPFGRFLGLEEEEGNGFEKGCAMSSQIKKYTQAKTPNPEKYWITKKLLVIGFVKAMIATRWRSGSTLGA